MFLFAVPINFLRTSFHQESFLFHRLITATYWVKATRVITLLSYNKCYWYCKEEGVINIGFAFSR